MSDAGIQVFNDADVLVIDGLFDNLSLNAQGTVVTDTVLVACSKKTFTVSGVKGACIVAVASSAGAVAHVAATTGTTATVTVYAVGGVGTSVKWYLFCDSTAAPEYLAVYNPAGKLVFNAAEKYMRFAGSMTVNANFSANSLTLPAGKTYAIYHVSPGGRGVEHTDTGGGTGETRHYLEVVLSMSKVVGNIVTDVQQQTYSEGPFTAASYPSGYSVDTTAFVLDVTGY